ncbi:hypothetical protein A9Q84_13725 [Halobacteriovorax marinus]|uniref:Uncharacterized protein n=1 Tax=Halobacteriovorax marinus TaxID=97084 RepID=A0A1Y5FEG7_9BACT|nr:hypothetical protein A9Q84_13725 [Halobacteriovorax marinus]
MFPLLIKNFKLNYKKKIFYLDSKKKTLKKTMLDSIPILEKIIEINPKLVFLSDDNALRTLGPPLVQYGVKIVSLGINGNPRTYFNANDFFSVYGVLERPLFVRGIVEINRIVGYRHNILILFDDSETSKSIIESIFQNKTTKEILKFRIKYQIVRNLNEIKMKINSIDKKNTHLFLGPLHTIKRSAKNLDVMNYQEVLGKISSYYKSHYYSFWKDYIIPNGAKISYGVDLVDHSSISLDIAYKIINNTAPKLRFVTPENGRIFKLDK